MLYLKNVIYISPSKQHTLKLQTRERQDSKISTPMTSLHKDPWGECDWLFLVAK